MKLGFPTAPCGIGGDSTNLDSGFSMANDNAALGIRG